MRMLVVVVGMVCLALFLATFGGPLYPAHAQMEFPIRLALPYIVTSPTTAPTPTPEPPTPTPEPPTPEPATPTPEPEPPTPPAPRTIAVTARAYEFVPSTIEVRLGEEVRFVVSSPDEYHTFTVKRSPGAQETLIHLDVFPNAPPVERTYTFAESGDYYLYCIPHEILGMTGTIRVTE